MGHGAFLAGPANSLMPELAAAPSKMLVMTVDPNADVDVRGTAGLETALLSCVVVSRRIMNDYLLHRFWFGRCGVGDGEAAVAGDYYFQVGAVGSAFEVGDEGIGLLWAASESSAVWSIQRSSRPGLSWMVCQASGLPACVHRCP